jgi:hypothetical protein
MLGKNVRLAPKLGRARFSDRWSPRTISEWEKAMQILLWIREDHGVDVNPIIDAARFRNGKFNASRLLELARDLWLELEPVKE